MGRGACYSRGTLSTRRSTRARADGQYTLYPICDRGCSCLDGTAKVVEWQTPSYPLSPGAASVPCYCILGGHNCRVCCRILRCGKVGMGAVPFTGATKVGQRLNAPI